jgi:23S rRNA pseudouridine1911/1915/1917 synthase
VLLNGRVPRKRDKVRQGDALEILAPPPAQGNWKAQAIPLEIVHEDGDILVINKPPGLVVHPGAGNLEGTLLNALLNHAPALARSARGIVHGSTGHFRPDGVVARPNAPVST